MRYKKGTFLILPNKDLLKGKPAEMQSIYMWLCEHADEDGVCFPTKSTISREAGCSHNTVDKYLKQLVEEGFLSITQRKKKNSKENTSNSYQVMIKEDISELVEPPTKNGMTPHPNIGSETNPNINKPNIIDITIENKITLGKEGESSVSVLQRFYGKLFSHMYGFNHKTEFSLLGRIFKNLLGSYSEIQIACLMIVFFSWQGMDDRQYREKEWLTQNAHAITLFKANVNKYEAYVRNFKGMSEEFNDDKILYSFVKSKMVEILTG